MGPVVRGVATVIGLARETYVNSKSKDVGSKAVESSVKEIKATSDQASHHVAGEAPTFKLSHETTNIKDGTFVGDGDELKKGLSDYDDTAEEEAAPLYGSWALDEAQDAVAEESTAVVQSKVVGNRMIVPQSEIPHLAEKFASTYPLQDNTALPRLGCSVIIPQRRPDSRKRGFIRAYAPVLEAKGISEEVFMDFIATFNVASQANPLLNAINLAAFSAHALPLGIGIAVAEAIRLAVDVSIEVHSRYRTNSFLDRINKSYFLPRGLVCFPMIWKPSFSSLITGVSMDTTAAEQSVFFNLDQKTINKFRGGVSTSRGNVHFPDAAPLTFPLLDDIDDATDATNRTMKTKLKNTMKSTNDYFDRRAQAKYAMLNPHSGLSNLGVRPDFKSRYSHPSHPAASGSLLGLITGGRYSTANVRLQRRQNQADRITSPLALGAMIGGSLVDKSGSSAAAVADFMRDIRLTNVVRTMRGKQVLYLVIVDAPAQEEVAEAQELLRGMGVSSICG